MSSIFEAVLAPAMRPAEENEGDYRVDGILYCGKCKTPKEMRIPGFFNPSETKLVTKVCKCKEAELEAEARERKRQERLIRINETMNALDQLGAKTRRQHSTTATVLTQATRRQCASTQSDLT